LLPVAEAALADALAARGIALHGKGYCERPEDNLIETVTPHLWASVKSDLEAGKGSELASKFLAAYSSSALAVNSFAPLNGGVVLPDGTNVGGEIRFEQERSAWATGFWPTLDVIVERDRAPVRLFVESKCIEYLRATDTGFSEQFPRQAERHLRPDAAEIFRDVFADRFCLDPLDAPQLLKDFLAAKRVANQHECRVVLLCVWWVPANPGVDEVFAAHADAATRLARALADPDVTLVPLTYTKLWDHWNEDGDDALRHHVGCLRERYAVTLHR
jgi:hypothetical protein